MGKRTGFRQHVTPPPPGFHEYAEAATEWVFRYKFTILVVVGLVVAAVLLWASRSGSGREARAWQAFAEVSTAAEMEQSLAGLEGTSAYPWAALRLGTYYYERERYQDAERVLEPLAAQERASAYLRGLALYVLGCTHLEMGDTAQAKNSFEKALTVNGKSPFLQELVARQQAALKDWPPEQPGGGETMQAPAGAGGQAAGQPAAAGAGETTTEPPAVGGETRSGVPTGKQ